MNLVFASVLVWWVLIILGKKMRFFGSNGGSSSGYSSSSTSEQVTEGIDGTGLTAIVTGASSGIGIETARVLALRGVHVVVAVRNVDAGRKVREEIVKGIPSARINIMELDLSSIMSVRKFASEYNSSGLPLNLLINNAGIYENNFILSQDNIELQFATNHIGPFLLTNLLLETMKNTVCETKREGRIVNVSSSCHAYLFGEGARFDTINDKSSYSTLAYPRTKLANVLHANELARRLKEEGVEITANSLHPGLITTNILRHQSYMQVAFTMLLKLVLKNIPQGAATTCYVALHPQVKGLTGEYFVDCNKAKASSQATDAKLAKKLWDFSLSFINSK